MRAERPIGWRSRPWQGTLRCVWSLRSGRSGPVAVTGPVTPKSPSAAVLRLAVEGMSKVALTRWLLLGLGLVLSACAGGSASASDCDPIPGVRQGLCPIPVEDRSAAPVDRLETVADADEQVSLEDYGGRIVVVNFWASWCGPCRAEQPDLNDAYHAVPDDEVTFLGVNIEDSRPNAQAHAGEFDIPYPSLFDPANDYASRFEGVGPRTIPTTILIDAEGRVAARILGVTDQPELLGLAEAIAEGS